MIHETAKVHPLALVEGVTVGARTRIWQFASVIRGAVLGADCNVASGATLDGPRLGDRCIIGHNVAMGPGFLLGDDCFVGPNVTFCNDRWPATHTRGFDQSMFAAGFVTVQVCNGASIGANAVLLPGVMIHEGAFVAAGAIVNRSVPPRHLFTRKGQIEAIGTDRDFRRMWKAGEC